MMMLYATGFNAWNQLRFDGRPSGVGAVEQQGEEPDDLACFTRVLDQDVDRVSPFFSYTIAHLANGQDLIAGIPPKSHSSLHALKPNPPARLAEASNGLVAVFDLSTGALHQHPSLLSLLSSNPPSHTFPVPAPVTHLLAHATGFAALTSTSQVLTWGDERYPACLGREPTPDSPASIPTPLPSLSNLPTGPITKLAGSCSGYTLAALTAGNDLYAWGSGAGQRRPLLPDLSPDGVPTPIVIFDEGDDEDDGDQQGKDIVDVAVGEEHMIVLTTEGEVFVVGGNGSGQIGLGEGVERTEEWKRVDLEGVVGGGRRVKGVAAGPRSSFLLVE